MTRPRRCWSLGVLVLVAALAAAACGDDDDAGPIGAESSATTVANPTGAPLKLMTVFEGTGEASASPALVLR